MNLFSIQRKGNSQLINFFGIKIKFRTKGGRNNNIYIISGNKKKKVKKIKGLKITFLGTNATIEINGLPCPKFENSEILCGTNSTVKIGSSTHAIKNLNIQNRASGGIITIGKQFSSQSVKIINENEHNLSVEIGDDCMCSEKIYIRPTDAHTIYDSNTKQILNYPENIKIGNHVWIGKEVTILKGTNIPNNFVIGANSIVTKRSINNIEQYNNGGILAGSPAKVIKTGINWDRLPTSLFENKIRK